MAGPLRPDEEGYQETLGAGSEVYVISPTGKRQIIPRDKLDAALAGGYKLEGYDATQEAVQSRKYGDQSGLAFAEGLARGVSFGTSDLLVGALDPEGVAGRKKYNPGLALAGEVGGSLVTLGAGGVAAGAGRAVGSRVAAKAGAGLGGRIAAGVATGATEGAVFGVGQTVSDLALSNRPLTAESVVSTLGSNVLYGAAFGGAAGGAGALLAEGAKAGGRIIRQRMERPAAVEGAANRADDLAGLTRKELKAAKDAEVAAIKDGARKEAETVVEELKQYAQETRKAYIEVGDSSVAKVLGDTKGGVMRTLDDPRGWIANPYKAEATASVLRKQEDALNKAIKIYEPLVEKAKADRLRIGQSLPSVAEGASANLTAEQSRWYAKAFDIDLKPGAALSGVGGPRYDAWKAAMIDGTAPLASMPAEMMTRAEAWLAKNQAMQKRIASFTDVMRAPKSDRLAQIDDAIETFGDRAAAAREAARPGMVVKGAGAGVGAAVSSGLMAMTVPAPLAFMAGAKAAEAATNAIMRRLGAKIGKATAAASGAMAEGVERFMTSTGRAAGKAMPAAVTSVLHGVRYATDAQVKANPPLRPFAPTTNDKVQAYRQREAELRAVTEAGPDGKPVMRVSAANDMMKRLAGISAVAPELASQLEQVATRRIEFLADKLPKRPGPPDMPIGPDTWQPSDMQIRQFARYADAVENPAGVLNRMASGTMTPEDAEVLQSVYPEMYGAIRDGIMERLPALQESMPYQKRLMLSIFFDAPVDPAFQPEVLSTLQGNYAAEPNTAGGTQAPPAKFGSLRGNFSPKPTPAQERAG